MALANVACLLARQPDVKGRGVLMVDWDLEAPGLHHYFHDQFKNLTPGGADSSQEIAETPGLIDLFLTLERKIPPAGYANGESEGAEHASQLLSEIPFEQYVLKTDIPDLYLLKAGCFDDDYSRKVNNFDWEDLYARSRWLFRALSEYWSRTYRYVLIDSRTGLTDTSGICTILLPEKLVIVFTPNRQSLTGVAHLIEKATNYRKSSDDVRPLALFPLPSRIESERDQLRRDWRYGNPERGIEGYQPLFEELFRKIYALEIQECDLDDYFLEVQIQQSPDFAFGEEIAVNVDKRQDRFSLERSYQTFMHKLITLDLPWEEPEKEATDATAEKDTQLVVETAEATFQAFSPHEKVCSRRICTRLVRLALPGEGEDSVRRVALSELDRADEPIVDALVESGLLVKTRGENGLDATIEMANEALLRRWERLKEWIENDREFLLWRQQLRANMAEWERVDREESALLRGASLILAERWLQGHVEDLNDQEKLYIKSSSLTLTLENDRLAAARRRQRVLQFVGICVGLIVVLILGYQVWKTDKLAQEEKQRAALTKATDLTARAKEALILDGNIDAAIAKYDEAIGVKPDYDAAYLNRGYAYVNKGDRSKAVADFEKVLVVTKDAETHKLAESMISQLRGPSPTPEFTKTPGSIPTPASTPRLSPTVQDVPPRIYVQVQNTGQLAKVKMILDQLKEYQFVFPREPLITGGPEITLVKYYRKTEEGEANQIVGLLQKMGVSEARASYVAGQENSANARPRHYEIWFGRNSLQ